MVSPRARQPLASSPTPSTRRSFWRPETKRPRSSKRSRRLAEMESRGIVLVIDNYDSFTYNLVQYLGELGEQVVVRRNNEISLGEVTDLEPVAAVLSPGPGTPGAGGQCHPAAILTEHGHQLLANFRQDARGWRHTRATVRDPIAE